MEVKTDIIASIVESSICRDFQNWLYYFYR